jgi:XisH protein
MPSFDGCHQQVVRALQNDGWRITDQQVPMKLNRRRVFIDLLATHGVNAFQIRKILRRKSIPPLGSTFFTVLC